MKIPKDRIGVLIGEDGSTKRKIEKKTQTSLNISSEGDVEINGEDSINVWITSKIVKAIARGFSEDKALMLAKEDYDFEIIYLHDYAKTQNSIQRLKGRVIGEQGKSRRTIEELTSVYVSVYGKTICLIGHVEDLELARRAVNMLLTGKQHSTVYKYLERERKKRKQAII